MTGRYVRATISVSKQFFKQYEYYPFAACKIKIDKIKPDTFILSTKIIHSEPHSVNQITKTILSFYKRAYNDLMPCIDHISVKNIRIDDDR